MGKKIIDITGERYGRLVVLSLHGRHVSPNGTKKTTWLCKCDCGKEIIATSNDLRSGHVKSCGCLKIEVNKEILKTHGLSKTRLYNIWHNIKARCFNPNGSYYDLYGGRGITMCDEWRNSFEAFYAWAMSHGYRDDFSIDRIDSNGNYEPDNCRWVSAIVQGNNTRRNKYYEYGGESHTLTEWSRILGINSETMRNRINYRGWTVERALTTPVACNSAKAV